MPHRVRETGCGCHLVQQNTAMLSPLLFAKRSPWANTFRHKQKIREAMS
jgi:hypothetical protein